MGGGEFARAASYVESLSAYSSTPVVQMILSRIDINADRISAALRRAHLAYESFGEEDRCDISNLALANLMSLLFTAGNLKDARERAKELEQRTQEGDLRMIAQGLRLAVESSTFGDIVAGQADMLTRFVTAEIKGYRWAQQNPAQAAAIAGKYIQGVPPDLVHHTSHDREDRASHDPRVGEARPRC